MFLVADLLLVVLVPDIFFFVGLGGLFVCRLVRVLLLRVVFHGLELFECVLSIDGVYRAGF